MSDGRVKRKGFGWLYSNRLCQLELRSGTKLRDSLTLAGGHRSPVVFIRTVSYFTVLNFLTLTHNTYSS